MDKNMDIKDLFKKLKESGGKKDARKGGKLNAFFEKNPKMKYILPAVVVAIAVAAAVIIAVAGLPDTELPPPPDVQGQEGAILPELERNDHQELEDGADPFAEDIMANAKCTGIIYNSGGYLTAILATKDNSKGYVVQVGDHVGTSDWYVEAIDDTSVTISMGEKQRTIEMG